VIVLDQSDAVVSREGLGDSLYLKACKACGVLVEHVRVTRSRDWPDWAPHYAYIPLADHDSQCRP
jgi:hypothetical protein